MKNKKILIFSAVAIATVLLTSVGAILWAATTTIKDGDVIKTADSPAVYYIVGGKKFLMTNRGTYGSWASAIGDTDNNFANLKIVTQAEFDSLGFAGNITVRPGTSLLKFNDSASVYAVGTNAKLYKLADAAAQMALYPGVPVVEVHFNFRAGYYDNSNPVATLTASSKYPDGTLVDVSGGVYFIDGGNARPVTKEGFEGNMFRYDVIRKISSISAYTVGSSLVDKENTVSSIGGVAVTPPAVTPPTTSGVCTDSDVGSDDIYSAGSVTIKGESGNVVSNDICSSLSIVKEFYCDGQKAASRDVSCANGCENGHCVKSFDLSVCTDSDGGRNYTTQGVIRGLGADGLPHANFDACLDATILIEEFCLAPNERLVGMLTFQNVTCPKGCKDGACVNIDTSCGVAQHKENGVCVTDFQSCTTANGSGKKSWNGTGWENCLIESCNSGYEFARITGTNLYECRSTSCIDSDGGQNYFSKGTVTMGYQTFNDYCSNGSLFERWCDSNGIRNEWRYCPRGCVDGACIQNTNCSASQHQENDGCEENTKSCNMLYGTGQQTWSGSAWGDCQAVSCTTNYEIKDNICVAATRSCSQTDDDTDTGFLVGTGIQTWDGSSWGMCNATSCLPGFELNGNRCFASFHSSCVDYDNGKDYFTKSYMMFGSSYGWDQCYANHNNDLGEWYCLGSNYDLQFYTCPKGCSNGSCIE